MDHGLGVEAAKVELGFKRLTVEADVRVGPAPCRHCSTVRWIPSSSIFYH